MTDSLRFSVLIPAHNESGQIQDTLRSISKSADALNLSSNEILVVCNGCQDETASVVRQNFSSVYVVETPIASKTLALNLGDAQLTAFPRFYLDADIRLSPSALTRIATLLHTSGALIASPRAVMDLEGCSWPVRAFYTVWLSLPYVRNGLNGTGVYALSREGRSRFGEFPQLIADDGYVRAHFKPSERLLVEECYALVRAPQDLHNLVKIKTRSRLGVYELQLKYPHLAASGPAASGGFRFVAMRPSLWAPALVYLGVNLYTRWRARRMAREKGFNIWERDDSRRGGAPGGG